MVNWCYPTTGGVALANSMGYMWAISLRSKKHRRLDLSGRHGCRAAHTLHGAATELQPFTLCSYCLKNCCFLHSFFSPYMSFCSCYLFIISGILELIQDEVFELILHLLLEHGHECGGTVSPQKSFEENRLLNPKLLHQFLVEWLQQIFVQM